MPVLHSPDFGTISYQTEEIYRFPKGLPAFEELRSFLLLQQPSFGPLVFLQSVEQAPVRLICLPLLLLAPDYSVSLTADELAVLEAVDLSPGHLSAFTVLTIPEQGPITANLVAPIILNVQAQIGIQSVQWDSGRSHCEPVTLTAEPTCS